MIMTDREFIEKYKGEGWLSHAESLSYFKQAIDRLDSLVKANEDRDLMVAKEALEAIFQADKFGEIADHVKFRNKRMTAAEVCQIGLAQFAESDKAEKKICQECGLDFETGFHSEENGTPDCSQHPFVSKAEKDAKESERVN